MSDRLNKIQYEREACSRCDGSGHYSYNSITGTECFKCRGTRKQLTKQAAKSFNLITEFKRDMLEVPASMIEPGDQIRVPGNYKRMPVEWAELDTLNPGRISIGFTKSDGVKFSWGVPEDMMVARIPTSDQFQEIAKFAMFLPGVEVS